MGISFDAALGIHQKAMLVRTQRAEVLANNIVNADTPNYKARDLDFKAMLGAAQSVDGGAKPLAMQATTQGHMDGVIEPGFAAELMFRQSLQPSIDGNTVDVQIEQAEYTKNAMDFQASFTFLNKKFQGLSKALRGE